MSNHHVHENPTANVLAWSSHASNVESVAEEEPAADTDEPPDEASLGLSPASKRFQKTTVRPKAECQSSLLTKALQSHSEDDSFDGYSNSRRSRRRRSLISNVSVASTVDLSCDTGLTTPARTSSPSPRLPQLGFAAPAAESPAESQATGPVAEEKRRCISFACAAKPPATAGGEMPPPPKPAITIAPKRPSIKFACAARPATQHASAATTPKPRAATPTPATAAPSATLLSPTLSRKYRSPSANSPRSARSVTPRRSTNSPVAVRARNYLTADSKDLQTDSSRFHEFASDEIQDDDWILQDESQSRRRLTIEDTLQMEMAIRRLGKEAEEEAEQEAAEDDEDNEEDDEDVEVETVGQDDHEAEDENGENDNLDLDEDDHSGYGSDNDSSDGYHTDEEIGFADSDDDDDDGLILWSTGHSGGTKIAIESLQRRTSFGEFSDSSAFSPGHVPRGRSKVHKQSPAAKLRPSTPELPDSTDFVCGTLDEDRPLEEAYMSAIAAKKREKLRLIPQDIDPSFPTSDPEDEDEAQAFKLGRRNSDEHEWLHGELEDLDLEEDRGDRRGKKKEKKIDSPKRLHSPPPPPQRRHHSPPPKVRGRSPRRVSPMVSLAHAPATQDTQAGRPLFQALAFRPGLTHTKSLPRTPAIFAHIKTPCVTARRSRANTGAKQHQHQHQQQEQRHVRGAIDIVKGLEQRRLRRREKLKEKQCNRARKGLGSHVKRPLPGKGAERMRELGLMMAGKIGPGNYMLSV